MSFPLIKAFIAILLQGLDYLNSVCLVAHTDLKLENIMVSFEDPDVIGDFLNSRLQSPMEYKLNSAGRPASKFESDELRGVYPIQANHYREPEVILGWGWKTSTDIWNLGVILWDIIEGKELFQQVHDSKGSYDARSHITEMIALIGRPPPELIVNAQRRVNYKWPTALRREDGKI
ncbi:kinase-like domain-containing protein [Aspergillus egyptiacus]|nr:kinase-like domain-containing protein [Aspergillus egyptiacus]